MSEFVNGKALRWQVGLETDIGGGRENQDDCLIWFRRELNICIICVLDGHGREVGKIASESAKNCLMLYFEENHLNLLQSPSDFLHHAHEVAHEHIKQSFKLELQRQGYEVMEAQEGYLMKRKVPIQHWSCIHGGTSCSIVAFVNSVLYIANVGDSTGILCSTHSVFKESDIHYLRDAAFSSSDTFQRHKHTNTSTDMEIVDNNTSVTMTIADESYTNTLLITSEHSPESIYEYERLRSFRPREGDPSSPSLVVVYDASSHDKSKCNPVFEINEGVITVTGKGSYFKNVRKEWASLVSTPSTAKYQDALAFTRSLGVTHLPEIQMIDLNVLFSRLALINNNNEQAQAGEAITASSNATNLPQPILCVVLATDGVWDNWLYEDVNKFVIDSSCLNAVMTNNEGAKRVAMSFMQRNSIYSKRNFGGQADNATGIVMYISHLDSFP
eukprot:gene15080-20290_t